MVHRFVALLLISLVSSIALAQGKGASPPGPSAAFSVILGRPTEHAVTVSVLSEKACEAVIEYGAKADALSSRTAAKTLRAGVPTEFEITGLEPDRAYVYRVRTRAAGAGAAGGAGTEAGYETRTEATFQTRRAAGEQFTFCVQGDSHPERLGRMYDPELYASALRNVAADKPDFYFMMGDDFSIERLIERGTKSQDAVNAIYAHQRGFLDLVGRATPLMLVNGNHEQAAKYLLDGTATSFAVLAGKARTTFFPLPGPPPKGEKSMYSGNATPVDHVGLLRDYYAWEWGDALFVVIDPYWHSDVAVDNEGGAKGPAQDGGKQNERKQDGTKQGGGKKRGASQPPEAKNQAAEPAPDENAKGGAGGKGGGGRGQRDLWQITLGDEQYRWLRQTLTQSKAPFKFVFSHHVLGTGRGGVEQATTYEWGGEDRRGVDRFFQMRPKWEQPIHDLMRDTGVTIFFQGHDHLYARQELDGVIYQSCPNPADPTFTAFNRDSYKTGVIHPNSGHIRVTVKGGSDAACKIEYVRAARPGDEAEHGRSGSIVHAYELKPRAAKIVDDKKADPTKPGGKDEPKKGEEKKEPTP